MKEKFEGTILGRAKNLAGLDAETEKGFREEIQKIKEGDMTSAHKIQGFFQDHIDQAVVKYTDLLDPLTKEELGHQITTELLVFLGKIKSMHHPFMYASIKDAIPGIVDEAILALGNQENNQNLREAKLIAEADALTTAFEQSNTAEGLAEDIKNRLGAYATTYIGTERAADLLPYLFGEEGVSFKSLEDKTDVSGSRLRQSFQTFKERIARVVSARGLRLEDLNTDAAIKRFKEKITSILTDIPETKDLSIDSSGFKNVNKPQPEKTFTEPEVWNETSLIAAIKAKGITSEQQYRDTVWKETTAWPYIVNTKRFPNLPYYPNKTLDWKTLLTGTPWTYETLRKDVLEKLKNGTTGQYDAIRAENNWPTTPTLLGMKELPKNEDRADWDAFFERKIFSLSELKKELELHGITSQYEYQKNTKKLGLPIPHTVEGFPRYEGGQMDWYFFFNGTKATLEDIQREAQAKNITSGAMYDLEAAKNNWPPVALLRNMPGFPRNEKNHADWETFLKGSHKQNPESLFG